MPLLRLCCLWTSWRRPPFNRPLSQRNPNVAIALLLLPTSPLHWQLPPLALLHPQQLNASFAAVWGTYKRPVCSTSTFRIEQGPTDILVVVRPPRKRTKRRKQPRSPRREFAGNASALSSSTPTGLQSDADLHWLADTGATSHMTPHYAWMRNYTPYVVDIHLADNTIVQSAGIGVWCLTQLLIVQMRVL